MNTGLDFEGRQRVSVLIEQIGDDLEEYAWRIVEQEEYIERLERDARRYRWIRDGGWLLIGEDRGIGPEWPDATKVDEMVDSAIRNALEKQED